MARLPPPEQPIPFPAILRSVIAPARPRVALPDPLTTLVGRDWEATEVGACLARPDVRLVTLTGPGGVGKTRLALRVATECEGLFEEGVCFVGLAQTTDPDHVLLAVARTLEIRCLGGERLVDLLASALDGRRLLLVLDNLEQVRGAAPRLVELLVACSGLKILATSREVLHVSGEHRYPVPPLSLGVPRPAPPSPGTGYADPVPTLTGSDAVGLFVDRARAVRPDFALDDHNVVLVAAICRRVDCLPLGIELAAARLRHLSLSSLLDLLDRRLPVLTGGPGDSPTRLRSMHGAIAWSCDLLTSQERAAFSRLSVFAGGFDLRAAETILRDDADPASPDPSPVGATRRHEGPAVIDIVSTLVDKSLLRIVDANDGRTRYGMLETVREFGLTHLAEEGAERDIRLRHLAWCQALAAPDAAPDDAGATRWLGRLDDDHPNITAALEWAIDDGNAPPIGPFVLALAPYWEARGHFVEGIRWLEMAVEREGGAPAADRLAMMSGAGTLAWLQGDFDRATHWHGQALILARAVGDRVAEAFAQNNLGVQAVESGDYDGATAAYVASLLLAETAGEPALTMTVLHNLGYLSLLRGDSAAAADLLEQTYLMALETTVPRQVAAAAAALGHARFDLGDHERAISLLLRSLAQGRSDGHLSSQVDALEGLARVGGATRSPERATRILGATAALREAAGMPHSVSEMAYPGPGLTGLRAALGDDAFSAVWAAGRALPLGNAIGEALALAALPPLPGRNVPATQATPAFGLTARESEILRLLASGESNRAIGNLLYISPATVARHVANIFGKLEVDSRSKAAVVARLHGLDA